MAQRFIKSSGDRRTPKEIGQEYFMELASRSLFQECEEDIYGYIIGCKMHDQFVNGIGGQEEDLREEEQALSSSAMLPVSSGKAQIVHCPKFSYMQDGALQLAGPVDELLDQMLLRNPTQAVPNPSMTTMVALIPHDFCFSIFT